MRKVRAEITLDILNMINLFDPKGGQFQYAQFNDILAVTPTVANGVLTTYNLADHHEPVVPALRPQRPPVALADAVGRTGQILTIVRAEGFCPLPVALE